jgi:hypothetical protein
VIQCPDRDAGRSMNATIMTVAKLAAIKAVKRELHARGERVAHIQLRIIELAASTYLHKHPELIEEAAETVSHKSGRADEGAFEVRYAPSSGAKADFDGSQGCLTTEFAALLSCPHR